MTVKRPQDAAPMTIAPPGAGGPWSWTFATAEAYVSTQAPTLPPGTVLRIEVTIGK